MVVVLLFVYHTRQGAAFELALWFILVGVSRTAYSSIWQDTAAAAGLLVRRALCAAADIVPRLLAWRHVHTYSLVVVSRRPRAVPTAVLRLSLYGTLIARAVCLV